MKREQGRGLLVLLLAAGLILGSGILVYCVWRDPNVAVAIGMLWTVGAVTFWVSDAFVLRFAPGRIVQRRIDRAIQGKWSSCLSPYNGSGQLLEEYQNEPEEAEENDFDPCLVTLTGRETLHRLTLLIRAADVQRLELREGDRVLLILSGLTKGVFLLGTLNHIEEAGEKCKASVTLWKGLICDREREVFL